MSYTADTGEQLIIPEFTDVFSPIVPDIDAEAVVIGYVLVGRAKQHRITHASTPKSQCNGQTECGGQFFITGLS